MQKRFLRLTRQAIARELDSWSAEPSRALALALSQKPVELGWVAAEPEQAWRQFWLMPLMHSEDLAVQEVALPLFEQFSDPRTAVSAHRHRDVIARFQRFPHRNSALGWMSSEAELAFLQSPATCF